MDMTDELKFKRDPRALLPISFADAPPPKNRIALEVIVALLFTMVVGGMGTGFVLLAWDTLGAWSVFPAIFASSWVFVYIWARITD